MADTLKQNSGMKIQILGHTDSVGDAKSNQALSERRAATVKTTLVPEILRAAVSLHAIAVLLQCHFRRPVFRLPGAGQIHLAKHRRGGRDAV